MEATTRTAPTPEQAPLSTPELPQAESLQDALSLKNIHALRHLQREAYVNAQQSYLESLDDKTDIFVSDETLDQADAEAIKSAEAIRQQYIDSVLKGSENDEFIALIDSYDYVAMPDETKWRVPETDEFGNKLPTEREKFVAARDEFLSHEAEAPAIEETPEVALADTAEAEDAPQTPSEEPETVSEPAQPVEQPETAVITPEAEDEQLTALKTKRSTLRNDLAVRTAKRQGRIFGGKNGDFQELQDEYNQVNTEIARAELKDVLDNPDLDETEKNARVIAYLFDEQAKLRRETIKKMKLTKVGQFVEFMNKGTRGQRVLKGIMLGAGVSVAGMGIGLVAGAAGVGAIGATVAAGGAAAWRFARGFSQSDARQGRGMKQLSDEHLNEAQDVLVEAKSDEERFDVAQAYFNDKLEEDTKKEQAKRRKSVAWGLGGIALGGAIGATIGFLADAADVGASPAPEGGHDFVDPSEGADGSIDQTPEPEVTEESPVEQTPEPQPEPEPEQPSTPEITYDPDFAIESGEGGIHFFQDLGLTEYNWYEVANELHQQFPDEFYLEGNDVRIAHPGQLSLEAQQFIKGRFGL